MDSYTFQGYVNMHLIPCKVHGNSAVAVRLYADNILSVEFQTHTHFTLIIRSGILVLFVPLQ
jgi:hypothetical protein